jgi:hypothetical protein
MTKTHTQEAPFALKRKKTSALFISAITCLLLFLSAQAAFAQSGYKPYTENNNLYIWNSGITSQMGESYQFTINARYFIFHHKSITDVVIQTNHGEILFTNASNKEATWTGFYNTPYNSLETIDSFTIIRATAVIDGVKTDITSAIKVDDFKPKPMRVR